MITIKVRTRKPAKGETGAPRVHLSSVFEVLIGRSLAVLVHPVAAWRQFSTRRRVLLVVAYSAVAYVTVLSALLALH